MAINHRPLDELDAQLIELIKSSPCIYDPQNIDFRFVQKKDLQWVKVSQALDMSDADARKRWTILRDRYSRELKLMSLHPRSQDLGRSEFFHKMDFLRRFVKRRRSRSKRNDINSPFSFESIEMHPQMHEIHEIEESQDSMYHRNYGFVGEHNQKPEETLANRQETHAYREYEADSIEGDFSENLDNSYTSSSINIKTEENAAISQSTTDHNEMKSVPSIHNTSTDSEDLFSKVIASYLKNLSRRYKIKAKVEMMQVLEKYIEIEENEKA
ncbi:hinge1 [Haematobia irritans]|uniref:hinge1 n=1 Tax=Haematobia irritans TaxID=7368 RepID=UPI003F508978